MARGLPKYRKCANGQAFVQHKSIDRSGNRLYLGKYDSPESKRAYQQFIARLNSAQVSGSPDPDFTNTDGQTEIRILISHWCDHGRKYYLNSTTGKPSQEFDDMMRALRWLDELYGETSVDEFGPRALKLVRKAMIAADNSRQYINHQVGRIKRFWRWAVSEELCRQDMAHGLDAVDPIAFGREGSRESRTVRPVKLDDVIATLPYLSHVVATMVKVQLLCGMRPQDIHNMRPCDVNRSGEIWIYKPHTHKNAWRGKTLIKGIPKTVQESLLPFLDRDDETYLFSPREAYQAIRSRHPPQRVGDKYETASYRRSIRHGITKANKTAEAEAKKKKRKKWKAIPEWSPNQLRHSNTTILAELLGQQKAQRWAGHEHLDTTAIYTEMQTSELLTIAGEIDAKWPAEL